MAKEQSLSTRSRAVSMSPDAVVLPVGWMKELERRLVCEEDAPPVVYGPVAPGPGEKASRVSATPLILARDAV